VEELASGDCIGITTGVIFYLSAPCAPVAMASVVKHTFVVSILGNHHYKKLFNL
jgi:hypothetical protein